MPSTITDRLNGLTTSVAVKPPCVAVSSSNVVLAGLQTIGGVTLADDDRVLLIGQTDPTENGIYNADSGDWTRALDFDGPRDAVQGTIVLVRNQFIAGAFYEVTSANPISFGTDAITFALRDSPSRPFDLTQDEIDLGITPTDFNYPPGDCRRYGASPAASAAVNAAAFNTALSIRGLVFLEGQDAAGTYVVDDNLDVQSDTAFVIGYGVTIQGAANKAWVSTGIIDINGRSNVNVQLLGTIDGNKANNATGRAFGIRNQNSTDVLIEGPGACINCPGASAAGTNGGDGIYIGGASTARVTVRGVLCSGNVRQGISVTAGTDIKLDSLRCINTSGSDPGGGIDCESDTPGSLKRITISNCICDANYRGLQLTDCEEVNVTGLIVRNNSWDDIIIVRVTDLYLQGFIGLIQPTVAQNGTVLIEGSSHIALDLEAVGNYDAQQAALVRLSEGDSDIRIRLRARNSFAPAIQIGSNGMGSDITDVLVEGCQLINCVDPAGTNGVIFLDGNSGGSFYPKRIVIRNNTIYDSRSGGNEAPFGVQVSTNIPASVSTDYDFGGNKIQGPTARYTGAPNEGTFTGALTGLNAATNVTVAYKRENDHVSLRFASASGTSNATTFTMTGLPQYLWPTQTWRGLITGIDNGVTQTLACSIDAAGGVTFALASLAAFTASGTKGLQTTSVSYALRP